METPQGDGAARRTVSRRDVLGGGLALGALALTGCGTRQTTAGRLPDPRWNAPVTAAAAPTKPVVVPAQPAPAVAAAPYRLLPRAAWTSEGIARPQNTNPMRGISRITVHHDGMTPFGSMAQSDAARRINQIRDSHIGRRAKSGEKWADIGYHYLIDPAGRVWEGRPLHLQGAHVQDNNEHNLGIVLLGNYSRQPVTAAAQQALDAFVADQMRRWNVPKARVCTHRELSPTECPGHNLQAYMNVSRSARGRLSMAAARLGLA